MTSTSRWPRAASTSSSSSPPSTTASPSLVHLDRTTLGSYAARGALTPLDDCIEEQAIDLEQYRDTALDQVMYDDSVYGIPEFANVRVILMNNATLNSAGVAPEDLDTSDWDALAAASKRLTKVSGGELQRIGFDPKIPEFFPLWVAANGGRIMSDDGLTPALNSPEAIDALEYTVSLVEATAPWAEFKSFRDTWDFFGGKNQFVSDQLGAFPIEDWYADVLADVSPDADISAAAFLDRDGEPLTYATGNAWAIPRDAPNQSAACVFMKTMTATDTWVKAAQDSKADREKSGGVYAGTFTANEGADKEIFESVYEPTGIEGLDQATQVTLDVQDAAIVDPPSPANAEIQTAWQDAILRVLDGKQSAQEALDQAQGEAEQALEDADR